eukprot:2195369-Pyramimonas_sp.AAC.1
MGCMEAMRVSILVYDLLLRLDDCRFLTEIEYVERSHARDDASHVLHVLAGAAVGGCPDLQKIGSMSPCHRLEHTNLLI